MLVFFFKYFPELIKEGLIYRFQTPVMALLDNKKIPKKWIYDLKGSLKEEKGLNFKYFKGLGGFTPEQLKEIISVDGEDKMFLKFNLTNETEKSINEWYLKSNSDKRKEFIINNDFDLIKI